MVSRFSTLLFTLCDCKLFLKHIWNKYAENVFNFKSTRNCDEHEENILLDFKRPSFVWGCMGLYGEAMSSCQ